MLNWKKVAKAEHLGGETTLRYEAEGTNAVIESRKRAIPHSARGGSWMHTTYFVILPSGAEHEFWRLQDAKNAVEDWRAL